VSQVSFFPSKAETNTRDDIRKEKTRILKYWYMSIAVYSDENVMKEVTDVCACPGKIPTDFGMATGRPDLSASKRFSLSF
jgi:hypothetical protein